jgi:hypothetical protein
MPDGKVIRALLICPFLVCPSSSFCRPKSTALVNPEQKTQSIPAIQAHQSQSYELNSPRSTIPILTPSTRTRHPLPENDTASTSRPSSPVRSSVSQICTVGQKRSSLQSRILVSSARESRAVGSSMPTIASSTSRKGRLMMRFIALNSGV